MGPPMAKTEKMQDGCNQAVKKVPSQIWQHQLAHFSFYVGYDIFFRFFIVKIAGYEQECHHMKGVIRKHTS